MKKLAERKIIQNGHLCDKKVLYHVNKVGRSSRYELVMFYSNVRSLPIPVKRQQFEDDEWMYYQGMSLITKADKTSGLS